MASKLDVVKKAANLISGLGVSKIANDIIKLNTSIETPSDAARIWIGSAVIGSMIAEHGSKHVNAKVEQAAAWFNNRKEEAKTKDASTAE